MNNPNSKDEMLRNKIILTSLNNMFKKGWLDICAIRNIGELLGLDVTRCEEYKMLQLLHCVCFTDMPRDVYRELPDLIKRCLSIEPVYQFVLVKNVIEVQEIKTTTKAIDFMV